MNKKINNMILLAISFALGIFLIMQYQTSQKILSGNLLPSEKTSQLDEEMKSLIDEKNKLKEELDKVNEEAKTYEESFAQKENEFNELNDELTKQRILSGYYDVKGTGVKMSINLDPNYGSIADNYYYILSVISYLNHAGAEAISINGQRYTNYTDIVPVSDHININGVEFALPIEIKAIGNKRTLEASLNFLGGVVSQMESIGFEVSMEYLDEITINKFEGEKTFKYAKPVDMIDME